MISTTPAYIKIPASCVNTEKHVCFLFCLVLRCTCTAEPFIKPIIPPISAVLFRRVDELRE